MSETNDNSVRPEKVWHVPYNDSPKHVTVVHRMYTQVVVDNGTTLACVHQDDTYPTEEAALLAIYEKKFANVNSAMQQANNAKKALDDCRKEGRKL